MARLCMLDSPLADALLFSRMHVSERLSSLFTIQLEAVSTRQDIAPKELLGKTVTIKVEHDDGVKRYYNGYASRFMLGGSRGRYFVYHLTLRPWLWFLSRTADCRIFQDLSVPDIIDQVLSDEASKSFESKLADPGKYEPWEYCVQYRESDLNFVSRLMEEEGIAYYFTHDDGIHTMVTVDSKAHHPAIAGEVTIPFVPASTAQTNQREHISSWTAVQEIQPGQYVLDDYDFKAPGNDLQVVRRSENAPSYQKADYEVFDYPGFHDTVGEGESWVAERIEELHSQTTLYEGNGSVTQFAAGLRFKLSDHSRSDQNDEFLLVSVDYDYEDPPFESGGGGGSRFSCRFVAIESRQQFRPPRNTPRPIVQGIQTAVVTGPAGDEIHTDKYGRIKVKFHWDRGPERNERSSCWMRVAFLAAGPRFGFVSIPRIGHEVVVDFLEGDPDRPLVTGVVYNGDNLPPWALPDNKTQSGLLTRSSKGGAYDNANAIRFEDKKGAEQLWLHAEKNQDIEVENDETHWVGHDRKKNVDHDETTVVGHDRTETVGNNETITIGVNRTEMVGANEVVTIGANRTHSVGASETWTVALQRTHSVGVNETIAIGAAQEIAIGAAQVVAIGAYQSTTVGFNRSVDVGANQDTKIGAKQDTAVGADRSLKVAGNDATNIDKDQSLNVGKNQQIGVVDARKTSVGKDDSLTVGKNLIIDCGDSITISTGSASITMKKDGTIEIKGKSLTIEGSQEVKIKAPNVSSDAGAKNELKGAMVEVSASGVNTIKGSLVKIN